MSVAGNHRATRARAPLRFAEAALSTGLRMHYLEQGDPEGEALIFLHGLADSWHSFSQVLPLLSGRYRAFALDQRGHGDSERPEEGYAMSDFAADTVAFMAALRLPQATVVGHSMGSLVAQQVALDAPERVRRLVLVGAASTVRTEGVLGLQQSVADLSDPVPEAFAREFQVSTVHHPLPERFLDQAVAQSLKLPARVWRSALAGCLAVDFTADLSRLRMPTLVVQGDNDATFAPSARDVLATGLANATLKTYPETGHAVHWERPERFARDLEDFLAHS